MEGTGEEGVGQGGVWWMFGRRPGCLFMLGLKGVTCGDVHSMMDVRMGVRVWGGGDWGRREAGDQGGAWHAAHQGFVRSIG